MRRFSLKFIIAAMFFFSMVPMIVGLVGYLYWNNTKTVLDQAEEVMQRSVDLINSDVNGLITPVVRSVTATAALLETRPDALRTVEGLRSFHQHIEFTPQTFSLYIGYEDRGDFYQVINIPDSLTELGTPPSALPPASRYAIRMVETRDGLRGDHYVLIASWGDEVGRMVKPPIYDPRKRPWYNAARKAQGLIVTDAYVYFSSKLIGVTVADSLRREDGSLSAVIGADVTMSTVSDFLRGAQVGAEGRVFIVDHEGRLVGHPDPTLSVVEDDGSIRLATAEEVDDPIVQDAYAIWSRTGDTKFEAPLGVDQEDYLVTFSELELVSDIDWTIGVIAKRDELIAPLKQSSINILVIGSLFTAFATLLIFGLSRKMTQSMYEVVEETKRIKKFDIHTETDLAKDDSIIAEVHELTEAVTTMKRALRSFSVYVPKELVRNIVAGGHVDHGAPKRMDLTVMFSDIRGFTEISEASRPEELVASLSEYFDAMSTVIHETGGIVDKYVGDAIMAMWNAPTPDPDHVRRACSALLACQRASDALTARFEATGRKPFFTRFGLHTGEAVVGDVGSTDRMQYSAFGAMVNLAARLEPLNKTYGTQIITSEAVALLMKNDFLFRELDRVAPSGIAHPIRIYELMAHLHGSEPLAADSNQRQLVKLWAYARSLYDARDWPAAMDAFQACVDHAPYDEASKRLRARCESFLTRPPPPQWDGADRRGGK